MCVCMSHEGSRAKVTATHRNTLQHVATHSNTLHHTAPHCNTLQHTAINMCVFMSHWESRATVTATHCNTLQHAATRCNALQHTATYCDQYARVHLSRRIWSQGQNSRIQPPSIPPSLPSFLRYKTRLCYVSRRIEYQSRNWWTHPNLWFTYKLRSLAEVTFFVIFCTSSFPTHPPFLADSWIRCFGFWV